MTAEKMIRAYFGQTCSYFSEGREEMLTISTMHPRHAGNAAEKLLRQAGHWVEEAGAPAYLSSTLWMTTTPLFRALVARAGE